MKKVLLIPQLSMSDGKKWEVAKDGNAIIMSLFGEVLKKMRYECFVYLPDVSLISSSLEDIDESIDFNGLHYLFGNYIAGSAADYRFNFYLLDFKCLKPDISLIVTSIPEQVPALRVAFGNNIPIISILSYITYGDSTAVADYFWEQYAGLRKSNLCFSHGNEKFKFYKGIDDFGLPSVKIYSLNLAFSEKRLKKQFEGFKFTGSIFYNANETIIFIPTRLEDDARTKYKSIIRLAKKYDNKGFKFIFANPGGRFCKELESANLKSQLDFAIESRADYAGCLKYSDAIVMFNDVVNYFSVAYYEAQYLNGNILRNEEGFENFMRTRLIKAVGAKESFSLENRASDIMGIIKKEIM